MGGLGSGRIGGKRTTGSMWSLDIRALYRDPLFVPERRVVYTWSMNGEPEASINIDIGHGQVVLSYVFTPAGGEPKRIKDKVFLSWTACHYGGERPWFLCPRCGRRVAVLWGGEHYLCRHCHNIAYNSQRNDRHGRLLMRMRRIKKRLGGEDWWRKPKWMHQRTYDKLREKYWHYEEAAEEALCQKYRRLFAT